MKLLTEKEIEEMAYPYICNQIDEDLSISNSNSPSLVARKMQEAYTKGAQEAQKLLLESASENFNQWVYKYPDKCDLRDFEKPNHNYFVAKQAWQACSLHHAKKMQEKDAEIKRLQQEVYIRNQYKLNQEGLDKAHAIYEAEIESLKRDLKYLLKGTEYFRPDMQKYCEEIIARHNLSETPNSSKEGV